MNRKARRTAAKQLRAADVKGTDQTTTQVLIDQAVRAAQAGNWSESERVLRHLLNVDPNHAEALHLMGMTLGSTGRASEGIELIKKATQEKPSEALYWNNLSTCYMAAMRTPEAIEAARKAVILEPGYVAAWSRLGEAYFDLGDFNKALESFDRVCALGGQELGVQKRMAVCLMNVGRGAEAEKILTVLSKEAPRDPDILGNLGTILVERQAFAEAANCLASAVEVDPSRAIVAFNYARSLVGIGEIGQAARWARKATSLDHRLTPAWLLLADILIRLGEQAEALVAIKRAAELAPGNEAVAALQRRAKDQGGPSKAGGDTGPVMWEFHLGDEKPMAPVVAGVDITGGKERVAPTAKTAPSKPGEPTILDFSVLKIG